MHRHLTIAFDESGDFQSNKFSAVGGVIVETIEPNEFDAMEMTCAYLEDMRSEGVAFYNHPPVYTDIYKNDIGGSQNPILAMFGAGARGRIGAEYGTTIHKNTDISSKVSAVRCRYRNVKLAAFRCLIPRALCPETGLTDGTYLKWLAKTMEFLLCEHLPSLGVDDLPCENGRTTLSIWLPTRSIRNATSPEALERDLRFDNVNDMLESVGGHSVAYQIMLRALDGRQGIETMLKKSRLKVRKIPYANSGDDTRSYESALHWYCPTHSTFAFPVPITAQDNAPTCRVNVSGDPRRRQDCRKQLVADYSVAQHLADACLTNIPGTFPSNEIENGSNICRSISFDIDAGEDLEDFLAAGRLFDEGRGLEAFEMSFRRDWFLDVFHGRNGITAPVGRRIQEKCREYALSIRGREIEKLTAS